MVYIRARNLEKLHEYKYAGVDKSLISKYILKPFYTHVVIKCFPMSMAPNAITLSGFSFVIINLLTMLYYNPTLDTDCPPWVYLSWSIDLPSPKPPENWDPRNQNARPPARSNVNSLAACCWPHCSQPREPPLPKQS